MILSASKISTRIKIKETADYFRRLAGHSEQAAVYRHPDRDGNDKSRVERFTWSAEGLPEITLLKVNGGGHTIPQSKFRFPEIYGATNSDINSLEEIWKFFERQGFNTDVKQFRKATNIGYQQ